MRKKRSFKGLSDKLFAPGITTQKRLAKSYISVFLIFVLLISSTAAWFSVVDITGINSDAFQMMSVNGLRVNDGEDIHNTITLEPQVLTEASSVDGRNVFFPTTGTFTSDTASMIFREANAGDKNVLYAYKDFTLTGDSDATYVYVKSFEIKITEPSTGAEIEVFDGSTHFNYGSNEVPESQVMHEECPIRVAFITDSSKKPIVIDPTAILGQYAKDYNAISSVTDEGEASTGLSEADSFADYYYGVGKSLFLLQQDPLDVTMVVWLEGTGGNLDRYVGKNISVKVGLESNYSDLDYIHFIDNTINDDATYVNKDNPPSKNWVYTASTPCSVVMNYKDGNVWKAVVMAQESDTSWIAPIPNDVITDISFYRYKPDEEIIYNAWHTRAGVYSQMNSKAQGWARAMFGNTFGSSVVQQYRTSDGTATGTKEYTYVARRGNGEGDVGTDYYNPAKQKRRLMPGIGYWGACPEGGSSGGGETPTEATTQAATDPITGGKKLTIGSISLGKLLSWVQSNLNNDGYNLYIELSDGTMIKMNEVSSDYYEAKDFEVTEGDKIRCFTLYDDAHPGNPSPRKTIKLSSGFYVFTNNGNASFEMGNDGTAARTN